MNTVSIHLFCFILVSAVVVLQPVPVTLAERQERVMLPPHGTRMLGFDPEFKWVCGVWKWLMMIKWSWLNEIKLQTNITHFSHMEQIYIQLIFLIHHDVFGRWKETRKPRTNLTQTLGEHSTQKSTWAQELIRYPGATMQQYCQLHHHAVHS